ncbi:hypothetical protein EDB81DRAFT_650358, partial [Dactylonectria macrodidyma]
NANKWFKELRGLAEPDVVVMLVGNKTDLDYLRAVSTEEAQNLSSKSVHSLLYERALHNYLISQLATKRSLFKLQLSIRLT